MKKSLSGIGGILIITHIIFSTGCHNSTNGNVTRTTDVQSDLQLNSTADSQNVDASALRSAGHPPSIATGEFHTCAITASGSVKCWGKRTAIGQLKDRRAWWENQASSNPSPVFGLSAGVERLLAPDCAILIGGDLVCWRNLPFSFSALSADVTQIATTSGSLDIYDQFVPGEQSRCALSKSGGLICWPDDDVAMNRILVSARGAQNLTFAYSTTTIPKSPSGLSSGVRQIVAGDQHMCALLSTGRVKCWGRNDFGQLGTGLTDGANWASSADPVDVSGLTTGVVQIAAGAIHTCALLNSGQVKCWGQNNKGQLGNGQTWTNGITIPARAERGIPTTVTNLPTGIIQIALGRDSSCALLNSGGIKCWGEGIGYIGSQITTPQDEAGLISNVKQISISGYHGCVTMNDGRFKCWGKNEFGQLGDGTTQYRATPVDVLNQN